MNSARSIDPTPGDHVLHKVGMARHIDNPEIVENFRIIRIGDLQMGKTKIDGHAAGFFLWEPVRDRLR